MASATVEDLEDVLGRLLLRSNRARLLGAALAAAPPGVDRGGYAVLSGLARLGPATSVVLAREIGLDRTGTSRYADRLVAAGLVNRRPDPQDGRAQQLILTARGRRAVAAMRASLTDHLRGLTEGLDDRALAALVTGLRLLVDPGAADEPTG